MSYIFNVKTHTADIIMQSSVIIKYCRIEIIITVLLCVEQQNTAICIYEGLF